MLYTGCRCMRCTSSVGACIAWCCVLAVVLCVWCTLCVCAPGRGEGTGCLLGVEINPVSIQKNKRRSKDRWRIGIGIVFQFYYACDLCFWYMMITCEFWFWFMIYDSGLWWLHVIYDFDLWWLCFEINWCDIFICVDLVKDVSLNSCDRKWRGLKMYLISDLPMRYDVNLFQFIMNLMEVMFLVQEAWTCPVGCLKSTPRISSNNERN